MSYLEPQSGSWGWVVPTGGGASLDPPEWIQLTWALTLPKSRKSRNRCRGLGWQCDGSGCSAWIAGVQASAHGRAFHTRANTHSRCLLFNRAELGPPGT